MPMATRPRSSGMLNWMFTWLKPEGRLNHVAIAPVVRSLFLDGLHGLELPGPKKKAPASTRRARPRGRSA